MDWIGHHCDIAHWGLSNPKYGCGPADKIGPLEVSAKAEFPPGEALWNTATRYLVECRYPNDVELVIASSSPEVTGRVLSPQERLDRVAAVAAGYPEFRQGTKWIGEGGWV